MQENREPEAVVREFRRRTRRKFSAEEKFRIVLEGLKGEESIAEICRREGISPNLYRTMKNVVTLQNYYLPGELEEELKRFVTYYNHQRVHESIENLTPADVYHGRGREILTARERLKRQTPRRKRRYNKALPEREEELIRPGLFREVSLRNEPTFV